MRSNLALSFGLLVCVAACGGGGGGSAGPPPPPTTIDLGSGVVSTASGRVVIVSAPTSLFATGIDYTAQWSANGTPVGTARVRAIDSASLALLVPTFPAGGYEARVTLPSVVARVRFDVAPAPTITDAATVVAAARASLATKVATLRTAANAEPDAAVRTARIVDLDRCEQWLAALETARQSASAADLQLAAVAIEQNTLVSAASPAFDEQARFQSVVADLTGARVAARHGVAAVAIGLAPGIPVVVSAALVGLGLVTVAGALPQARSAVRRPFKPIDAFVVQFASQASGVTTTQPTLQMTSADPETVVGHANFGSLAAADRSLANTDIVVLFADLDALLAPFFQLAAPVAALIDNRPTDAPVQRVIERAECSMASISIEVEQNPLVDLTLAGDQLTAVSFAGPTPVSTIGLFRYEGGAQGSLTTPVTVEVTQ